MKVGYVPYSNDLSHPADRRRIVTWAKGKNVTLEIKSPLECDVLVLSNAANFEYWIEKAKQPIILDLVDGYLGEKPMFIRDFLRNCVRTVNKKSRLKWIRYTKHMEYACKNSAAVIVASIEQKTEVEKFNKNIYVILDDHQEISDALSFHRLEADSKSNLNKVNRLFWEGFGYTLKHFKFISRELDDFLWKYNWQLDLVTPEFFPKWGGYIGKVKTKEFLSSYFPKSHFLINVIPWSLENLVKTATPYHLGIIPIDKNDRFGNLKSENKLLSMWELRIPVIFSNIPSYYRVANEIGIADMCVGQNDWSTILTQIGENSFDLKNHSFKTDLYLKETHSREIIQKQWHAAIYETFERANA